MNPDLDEQLDRTFALARDRGLDLDFHVDESGDPESRCLHAIAEAALRHQFVGKILCGHCCSLAVQPPDRIHRTLDLVREAGIAIVSLPMCNLYLQDRHPHQTPRWRGVTCVREIAERGIPLMLASDNCRDPFFGFGDHDGLEVLTQSVRIAHLDRPYGDWPAAVSLRPADWMGLPQLGRIGSGLPADFLIFRARHWSELLSRPQSDRLSLHRGQPLAVTLPDYGELDDLLGI